MVRRVKFSKIENGRKRRGQSLVEFSIISVLLFFLIMGIMEMGRFMFVYSVVSNSAQEGSRQGVVRPRDVFTVSEAATRIARGTPVPTHMVVANGNCNVVAYALDKVWMVPKAEVRVAVSYDNGNGTPIPYPTIRANPDNHIKRGNRIIVESTYNFQFVVPFINMFVPNGIDVRMRSARTMLTNGNAQTRPPCEFAYTLAPTPNIEATQTALAAATMTVAVEATQTAGVFSTATAQINATQTAIAIATQTQQALRQLQITFIDARKLNNSNPLNLRVRVTDGTAGVGGVTVKADIYLSGVYSGQTVTLTDLNLGDYQLCNIGPFSNNSVSVRVTAGGNPLYRDANPVTQNAVNASGCP